MAKDVLKVIVGTIGAIILFLTVYPVLHHYIGAWNCYWVPTAMMCK